MNREDKNAIVDSLSEQLSEFSHFYIADISALNAEDTSDLRRKCFENDIKLIVAKNTLLKRAMEKSEIDYSDIYDVLKGSTSVMFTNTGNAPGKLIKEFRKSNEKPILKGAYVEESVYLGDENVDALASLKSHDELIADVIALLQSPVKTVLSQLQSGGNIIGGVVKTLSERE